MKVKAGVSAAILFLLITATSSFSDEYHYQNNPIGDRSAGMGGAYIGVAEDANAPWYNAAGLGLASQLMFNVTATFYNRESMVYKGYYSGNDLGGSSINTFAPTVGYVIPTDEYGAFGLSILVTDYSDFCFSQSYNLPGEQTASGYSSSDLFKKQQLSRQIYVGPSWGINVLGPLSIGTSLFALYAERRTQVEYSYTIDTSADGIYTSPPDQYANLNVSENSATVSLLARLDFLYEISRDYRLGLTISSPTFYHTGNTVLMGRVIDIPSDDSDADPTLSEFRYSNIKTSRKLPLSFGLGFGARPTDGLLLDLDVHYHLPLSYTAIESKDYSASERDLDSVININVGGEYWITPMYAARLGFFTDFSSAKPLEQFNNDKYQTDANHLTEVSNQPDRIDYYGLTAALAMKIFDTISSLGIYYKYGTGEAVGFDFAANSELGESPVPIVDVESHTVGLMISGSYPTDEEEIKNSLAEYLPGVPINMPEVNLKLSDVAPDLSALEGGAYDPFGPEAAVKGLTPVRLTYHRSGIEEVDAFIDQATRSYAALVLANVVMTNVRIKIDELMAKDALSAADIEEIKDLVRLYKSAVNQLKEALAAIKELLEKGQALVSKLQEMFKGKNAAKLIFIGPDLKTGVERLQALVGQGAIIIDKMKDLQKPLGALARRTR